MKCKVLAIDTETTGLDFYHGSRPFFVGTFDGKESVFWQWRVDPRTRRVVIPPREVRELKEYVNSFDLYVLHNSKFDIRALATVDQKWADSWPWDRTVDTLTASHLLNSGHRHDLTSVTEEYLGTSIQEFEDDLEKVVKEARKICRSRFKDWRIAAEGEPDMPSARGKSIWRSDYWLPRELFLRAGVGGERMEKTLRAYALHDPVVTWHLWRVMEPLISSRSQTAIFNARMKEVAALYVMERASLTYSQSRMDELRREYKVQSDADARTCSAIAATYRYNLELPKGASPNKNLRTFMLDVMQLEPVYSEKSKSDAPTLDKNAMQYYKDTLETASKSYEFVTTLLDKRERDTSLSFMNSYDKFGIRDGDDLRRLYCNINHTGTATLRCSCNNPNGENISNKSEDCEFCDSKGCAVCKGSGKKFRSVRYSFGPGPGREWWAIDYENLELRLPTYEAEEKDMMALFEQPDAPPYYGSVHMLNFHTVFPDIWERELKEVGFDKVGPHCKKRYKTTYYHRTKCGGFCKQYGGQKNKTDQTFGRAGAFEAMESRFVNIAQLNRRWIKYAEQHGYVETIPDRTVDPDRGYPLACTRNEHWSISPTLPFNYRIQGSACWVKLQALVRCEQQLSDWRKRGFDAYCIMDIHDELLFDLPAGAHPLKNPKNSNLSRVRELAKLMRVGGDNLTIKVPTTVNVEYHPNNWADGVVCKV